MTFKGGAYGSITRWILTFSPIAGHPTFHGHFQSNYGDDFPDLDIFFQDPSNWDVLIEETELLKRLRDTIIEQLIAPYAVHTPSDPVTYIKPIINRAHLAVKISTGVSRISRSKLEIALKEAKSTNLDYIKIYINLSHLVFDTSKPISFYDWSVFSMDRDAPTGVTPAPTTPDSKDLAAAIAGAIPTADDMGKALADAFAAAGFTPGAGTTTGGGTPAPAPRAPPMTIWTFNPGTLPGDVQRRYNHKQDGHPICGNTLVPYRGGHYYHLQDADKIVTVDGTLFFIEPAPSDKELLRNPIRCVNDTHIGRRQWYQSLTHHAMSHGFYVHPFFSFRRDHGGLWGFTAGNAADDDLPLRMQVPLERMTITIYQLLMTPNMFPANSKFTKLVASCYNDGYKALKMIIFNAHPAFADKPATMLKRYPQQRDSSMLEYHERFVDFIQLRAYITNHDSSLEHDHEVDLFISNTKYHEYLARCTRDERRSAAHRDRYRGPQLVETLEKFLAAQDSPALLPSYTPPRSSQSTPRGSRGSSALQSPPAPRRHFLSTAPTPTAVHSLSYDAEESPTDSADTQDSPIPVDALLSDVQSLTIPDDDLSHQWHQHYSACIHQIRSSPSAATLPTCIACGGQHTFSNCTVLQNLPFLRDHYIRWCQYMRREQTARSSANTPAPPLPSPPRQASRVSYLDATMCGDTTDDDSFDEATDFQLGRS